jgi:anti-sigma factor RsiW
MKLETMRGPECASDLVLDRWHAGELSHDEVRSLTAHIATCTRCSERRDTLAKSREAFDASIPDWLRVGRHEIERESARPIARDDVPATKSASSRARGGIAGARSRAARWLPRAAAALALAAGIALFVKTKRPAEIASNERLKGAGRLTYHVKHDGVVREGGEGEHVAPGDALQFSYSTTRSGYLAIVSVDGARNASVYWPSGNHAAPTVLGRDVSLPASIILDDTLGPETIYGLFCAEPIALETIRSELEHHPDREPHAAGCTVERVNLVKGAR